MPYCLRSHPSDRGNQECNLGSLGTRRVTNISLMVNFSEGALVCDVFLCFCHFPIWCPGSGVEHDLSIPEFCLLPYFYLIHHALVRFHVTTSTFFQHLLKMY